MNRITSLLAALLLSGCTSASSIITGQTRPQYDQDKVVIYMAPPSVKYEVIGLVTSKASRGWSAQGHMDSAVRNLKEVAAELGANGIILGGTGTVSGPAMAIATSLRTAIIMPTDTPTVSGTAIWVEQDTESGRAAPNLPPVATADIKTHESSDKKADLYTELTKLDELHIKGILTDPEFEKQKQKLLKD